MTTDILAYLFIVTVFAVFAMVLFRLASAWAVFFTRRHFRMAPLETGVIMAMFFVAFLCFGFALYDFVTQNP